jgi:hypothetical protein
MPETAERVEQPQGRPLAISERQCIGVSMLVWFFLIGAAARYGWKNPEPYDGKAGTAWNYAVVAAIGIPAGLIALILLVAFLSIPFVLIFG